MIVQPLQYNRYNDCTAVIIQPLQRLYNRYNTTITTIVQPLQYNRYSDWAINTINPSLHSTQYN